MKVSIIVCSYNRAESLKRTLASLSAMDVAADLPWELIIVDNNSKDNTKAVVDDVMMNTDMNIKYVLEKKQGHSHARNRGVKEKSGEITVFTDDDVLVDKNWLTNIVKAFEIHNAQCIGGKILPVWETSPPRWLKKDLHVYLALLDYGEEVIELERAKLWGANFAVRSSMFEKYGTFNTRLGRKPDKLYGNEDTEFMAELLTGGEKILYCPEVIVHHCIPSERMKKNYFRKWKYDEAELIAMRQADSTESNLMGISLYATKSLVVRLLGYLRTQVTTPRDAFIEELKVISAIGSIVGRLKYKKT